MLDSSDPVSNVGDGNWGQTDDLHLAGIVEGSKYLQRSDTV